jgi:hypothetical protein
MKGTSAHAYDVAVARVASEGGDACIKQVVRERYTQRPTHTRTLTLFLTMRVMDRPSGVTPTVALTAAPTSYCEDYKAESQKSVTSENKIKSV